MKAFVKIVALALLALTFAAAVHAAPLDFSLGAPLNASAYAVGATAVTKIRVLAIDYQLGVYRFQLLDATGTPYNSGAVYGANVAQPSEANAKADITAAITAGGG